VLDLMAPRGGIPGVQREGLRFRHAFAPLSTDCIQITYIYKTSA
jgi:hypothetical protein